MKNKDNNNYTGATVISFVLHGALIGGLLWGADFSKAVHQPVGQSIEAVVIDPSVVSAQAKKIREQRDEAKRQESDRLKRLEQQAEQLEKQREQEEKRLRELRTEKLAAEKAAREAETERKRISEAKKKAAEEQRKAEDAARVANEKAAAAEAERVRRVEQQRKAEEAAKKAEADRQRAEQERLKAEEERKRQIAEKKKAEEEARKADEERKRKLAEKKKAEEAARKAEEARKEAERKAAEAKRKQVEQEAALNELFSGLESESANRDTARGRFISDEKARYGAIYTQMIRQNLLVDDSFLGQECVVKMRLSGTGLLLDVAEAGGNASLCRATKTAVLKVSSFPMPEDQDVAAQLQDIELTVKPE
ncbi:cell envelope integrity protein TolA [Enterovibrio sp. ZSDZ35]|uniref:Cell envelope integrity protein TolA n=1 Tax=Enterovibrio qingdaonensis TaxID=2899818 RepID=A0ABT5QNE5_9GAMM|nr:cell envelope integrity protein TolA [Enterovibrio sp. ZSDZ35]MDD1782517.1 cell envelope integrity protein TolA [Enterovibrio sp. ZSDZ35]